MALLATQEDARRHEWKEQEDRRRRERKEDEEARRKELRDHEDRLYQEQQLRWKREDEVRQLAEQEHHQFLKDKAKRAEEERDKEDARCSEEAERRRKDRLLCSITKISTSDDLETYIDNLEKLLQQCDVPEGEWLFYLTANLSRKYLRLLSGLMVQDEDTWDTVKPRLLATPARMQPILSFHTLLSSVTTRLRCNYCSKPSKGSSEKRPVPSSIHHSLRQETLATRRSTVFGYKGPKVIGRAPRSNAKLVDHAGDL